MNNNLDEQIKLNFIGLINIVKKLRSVEGCDWDKSQTESSLIPYFLEEIYELIVSLKGNINPETGFVYDLSVLKEIIKENIEEKLDHKNLNIDVPEFSNLNPTAENIVVFIYDELRKHIEKDLELEVTLYETPRNFVKFSGDN